MRKRVPLGDLFNIAVGAAAAIYANAPGSPPLPSLSQSGLVEFSGVFNAAGDLALNVTRNGVTVPLNLGTVTANDPFLFTVRLGKGDQVEIAHSAGGQLLLLSCDLLTD